MAHHNLLDRDRPPDAKIQILKILSWQGIKYIFFSQYNLKQQGRDLLRAAVSARRVRET